MDVGMLWPLVNLLVNAVVLRAVAFLVPGFTVDGWATALKVGAVTAIVSWIGGFVLQLLPAFGIWLLLLSGFVLTTIVLGVTSLMLEGMKFRGFVALIVASLLVCILGSGPTLWGPLLWRFLETR